MKYIISSLLYLGVLFCLSTFVFDPTHLYYELPWLDIPMHILGGFGVASLTIAVASYKKQKFSFAQVILFFLCIAVVWELYEYIHDLVNSRAWNGWHDTIWDSINGAFGASVAYFLLKK